MIKNDTGTRVDTCFSRLRADGKKGFVAYITAGDPSLGATADMVSRLEEVGVDLVELGMPFSDPLADGRVNQMSATRALAAGATVEGVLRTIERIRRRAEEVSRGIVLETADLLEEAVALAQCEDHDRVERETALLGLRIAAFDRVWHVELDELQQQRDAHLFIV